eukprot:113173-Amorphochlora_amoeboformis.AAC.2
MTDDKKGADDKTRSSASKPSQLDDWPTLYKRGEVMRLRYDVSESERENARDWGLLSEIKGC